MIKHLHLFYGWIIVFIAVISMILIYGIRHAFSVFFPSILEEFGWKRGSTAIMLSLNIFIYGFLAPFAGYLGDKWKPRVVILAGIIILGLSTAGCALAFKLWHFYLFFGILAPVGTALCGWPLLAPALANWFATRRGLALGIGQMGGGLSFAYSMVAEFAISQFGWRYAYLILAVILMAFLMPITLFFFHYRPEDKGLNPYGYDEKSKTTSLRKEALALEDSQFHHWTLRAAMRTYRLWSLVFSEFFFWGIGTYLVLAHQVKFVEEAGYNSILAASVFGLFGISMLAGQASSSISDWIGREIIVSIASIMAILALFALISVRDTSQPWLLYAYAISFGFGAGLYSPTIFAGAADIFHGRNFGAIAGLLMTGIGAGGAIGPWLGGYIYDISGSYMRAFSLAMVCFVIACITFIIAAPRKAWRR